MRTVQTSNETVTLPRGKVSAFVSQTLGNMGIGRDDEHPMAPGPWDPIIRKVAARVFGPQPEPWLPNYGPLLEPWLARSELSRVVIAALAAEHPEVFDVLGGGRFSRAALNPQPLPPRVVFIAAFAQEVIDRTILMQEVADAIGQPGERGGMTIVGGRLSLLVDELCGNNFKVRIPFPKPKRGEEPLLSGLELLTAGAAFEQAASFVEHERLQHELRSAGTKLIENGFARL